MPNLTVERSIWINASRERVWQAITQEISQWWDHDYWEITTLELGATVKFGDTNDPILGKIAVLDAPREFSLAWPPQAQYHSIEMTTTYRLSEENDGTRVTVTETGFEAMVAEIRQERFDSTMRGYGIILESLRNFMEGR